MPSMTPAATRARWRRARRRMVPVWGALDRYGITVRENFYCCGTCGHDALHRALDGQRRSFVFWHEQADDRMKDGDTALYLQHGFTEGKREMDHVAAMRWAVQQLCGAGFKASWSGDIGACLEVDFGK